MATQHVIFLGAGASATSGYPVGKDLRLLMSSKEHFTREMQKTLPKHPAFFPKLPVLFDEFRDSVELFRHGGFASVDEFSKLASDSYPEHVQNMKRLMRLVFSLYDPEDNFKDSDYYSFVQRLFRADNLNRLRNDVSVITFNYDCYLDFVLSEAYRYRQSITKIPKGVKDNPDVLQGPQPLNDLWAAKLSSGFNLEGTELSQAWRAGEFNFFKLHGAVAYRDNAYFGYNSFYRPREAAWFDRLESVNQDADNVPPVVFPWEILRPVGLVPEAEFIFVKNQENKNRSEQGKRLYQHFQVMWASAREIIQEADKISFVGLAIHEYLNDGLKFLFDGFANREPNGKRVQVVVANPGNKAFQSGPHRTHPASPSGRVAELLDKIAPKLKFVRSSSEDDGTVNMADYEGVKEDHWERDITPRYSFEDFIRTEMG